MGFNDDWLAVVMNVANKVARQLIALSRARVRVRQFAYGKPAPQGWLHPLTGSDHLTLLVEQYAQARYLPRNVRGSLSANVQAAFFLPKFFPLPHPSWRSTGWMARNLWFERKVLPALREAVRIYLD